LKQIAPRAVGHGSCEIVTLGWRLWVDSVAALGLPWDKEATAYFALAIAFYLVGLAFKLLVSRET
jgi:hypothetical protein